MGDVEYNEEVPDDMILFAQPTSQETRKMNRRRTRRKRTTVTRFPFKPVLNGVATCAVVSVRMGCKFQQTSPIGNGYLMKHQQPVVMNPQEEKVQESRPKIHRSARSHLNYGGLPQMIDSHGRISS